MTRLFLLALLLSSPAVAAALASPASAGPKTVTCEGTLEHGSGGEYIGLTPQCWVGFSGIEEAVLAVCKPSEHCKITGIARACAKNPDRRLCLEITKLVSVSK